MADSNGNFIADLMASSSKPDKEEKRKETVTVELDDLEVANRQLTSSIEKKKIIIRTESSLDGFDTRQRLSLIRKQQQEYADRKNGEKQKQKKRKGTNSDSDNDELSDTLRDVQNHHFRSSFSSSSSSSSFTSFSLPPRLTDKPPVPKERQAKIAAFHASKQKKGKGKEKKQKTEPEKEAPEKDKKKNDETAKKELEELKKKMREKDKKRKERKEKEEKDKKMEQEMREMMKPLWEEHKRRVESGDHPEELHLTPICESREHCKWYMETKNNGIDVWSFPSQIPTPKPEVVEVLRSLHTKIIVEKEEMMKACCYRLLPWGGPPSVLDKKQKQEYENEAAALAVQSIKGTTGLAPIKKTAVVWLWLEDRLKQLHIQPEWIHDSIKEISDKLDEGDNEEDAWTEAVGIFNICSWNAFVLYNVETNQCIPFPAPAPPPPPPPSSSSSSSSSPPA